MNIDCTVFRTLTQIISLVSVRMTINLFSKRHDLVMTFFKFISHKHHKPQENNEKKMFSFFLSANSGDQFILQRYTDLTHYWVVNNTKNRDLLDGKPNRYANKWEPADTDNYCTILKTKGQRQTDAISITA